MRARNPGPPALLDALAERHIAEAAARGAFDDLPGTGEERRGLLARMNFLLSRRVGKTRNLRVDEDYFVRVAERLGAELGLHISAKLSRCRSRRSPLEYSANPISVRALRRTIRPMA